jgi:7,8-dihydropterin-6-yl-methyl-4-(beta-D-ribofuranosyl)aminobenzene 5'-phosphate synthase
MSQETIPLLEVDEVRVTIVMDNSIDVLMSSTDVARRLRMGPDMFTRPQPMAEHGFSVLIQVTQGDDSATVLFDTGLNPTHTIYNIDAMEVDLRGIQAIVLSHGHPDHSLGLPGIMGRLGRRNMPMLLHPDAYLERKLVLPSGLEVSLPPPRIADLRREGIEPIEEVGPSMLLDDMLLVSGEVARTTEFERGFPIHYSRREQGWEPDPWIKDDQCAIANVRDKGLVIVTGCGHSGIVNIIRNAQALTGIEKVHAVIGGFHLSGAFFEQAIAPTVAALKEIEPDYVVPGHCTGWRATHQIAHAMPGAYVPNSVGTTFVLS